jgi:hypothetical protein
MKNQAIKLFTALSVVIATSVVFTGCKKNEEDKKPTSYTSSSDNSIAENAFAGIMKQISAVSDSTNAFRTAATCGTITITPYNTTTWPKTLVINFGNTNCMGSDYNNRRGIITAVFSGPYLDSGTVVTITLTNYYHNDYKIQGTQTIKNKGHNAAGHLLYNVNVVNATVTHPTNGKSSTWTTVQEREFVQNGPGINDDYYLIRGNSNGVSMEGESYTITTNSDLRVNVGCPWIVSGAFTLTLTDYPNYPIVFDYGNGACDGNATATFNGTTYNVVMY